jgi:hypothetical protein
MEGKKILWLTVIVLGLVGLFGFPKARAFYNEVQLRKKAPEWLPVTTNRVMGKAYLRGRVGVLNVKEKKWDWLIGNYLPKDLVAHRPQDVSTVIYLDWDSQAVGVYNTTTYRDGRVVDQGQTLAKQQNCKVTIVDLTIPAIVGEQVFAGRPPSAGYYNDGTKTVLPPGTAPKPIEDVEAYLLALPRLKVGE